MPDYSSTELHTERLRLRPFRAADATALFALFSDPQVLRYLSRPAWTDITQAHERIQRDIAAMAEGGYLCLGLERRHDGALIGECSLFNFVPRGRRAEIGYALAPPFWGCGAMGEALRGLLEHGYSQLDLNRVEADIDPRNGASARTLDRLGFKQEGRLRERWIVDGEASDSALYGLLRSDWSALASRA